MRPTFSKAKRQRKVYEINKKIKKNSQNGWVKRVDVIKEFEKMRKVNLHQYIRILSSQLNLDVLLYTIIWLYKVRCALVLFGILFFL